MTATLGLGTYRTPATSVVAAAERAVTTPVPWVDTAPNYCGARAHRLLAPVLQATPQLRVATKTGFLTPQTGREALAAGVITDPEANLGHSLNPSFVRWQIDRSLAELGRDRLDVVFVHNPERVREPGGLAQHLRGAFEALEVEAWAGRIGSYGVATWNGFSKGWFNVASLDRIATEAAGTPDHHLRTIQLPVSLIEDTPLHQALRGRGPITHAADRGWSVHASAPLHGGTLARLDGADTLANLIRPGASAAEACLASHPAPASPKSCCPPAMRHTGNPHLPRSTCRPCLPTPCGASSMYSPPPDPADERRMTTAHTQAAAALGATVSGPLVWGYQGRTLGRRADDRLNGACWLRLQSAPAGKEGNKHWEGQEIAARHFPTVRKPALHAIHDTTTDRYAYRAELTAFVDQPVLSPDGPVLNKELDLSDAWFKSIRSDLDTIAATPTDRIAVRQQWIDRAVPQFTGHPAPHISDLTCAHGDFHLANITATGTILDWEGFGLAPRGWDTALLYAYALNTPATADRIRDAFTDILETDAGRIALLIAAADLLQSASRGDHSELEGPLRDLVLNLNS
ncbi:aldo/keto reductase [Streptomyces sp. NPDC051219]|uniref:aldo/keto reductase n=1 Tax=Streptomyces sp. NPDC051219 TaxID=3155283 RepID=UPI0034430752